MSVSYFAASDIHISISSQPLFYVLGLPITNTMVTGALGLILTVAVLWYASRRVKHGK